MKASILAILVAAFLFVSCNNDKNHTDGGKMHSDEIHGSQKLENKTVEIPLEETGLLSGLIDSYLLLKDALVNEDNKKAASSADLMLKSFANFDMSKLTEKQHKEYMEIAENSKEQLQHIIKSPIDHQREHFEVLSNDLNDLIVLIGTDKHLYVDFCSMYNNNKGASWISETAEIKNPYYGSKMMACGSVQKEFN